MCCGYRRVWRTAKSQNLCFTPLRGGAKVLWLRTASLTVPGNLPGKASTWHGQTHSRSSQKEFPGNTSGFPPTELWAAELRCSFPMLISDAQFSRLVAPGIPVGSPACPAIAAAAGDEHTLLLGLCIAHNSFDSFWLLQEPTSQPAPEQATSRSDVT